MFRRISPFMFTGLSLLTCFTQGLPGEGGGGGGGTPPAGAPAGAPPAGAAPPAGGQQTPPAGELPPVGEPGWVKERVKQAKDSQLRETIQALGITDIEAGKKLLEDGKKAADAQKTEIQRKDDEIKALTPHKDTADRYGKYLQEQATEVLSKLTPEQQTTVKGLAGEDPIKVLQAAKLLGVAPSAAVAGAPQTGAPAGAPNGALPPGQAGIPGQGTPPTALPGAAPANTTGAHGGPPSATQSPVNHLAVWEDMKAKNPFAAGQYLLEHQAAIVEARQAKASK